MRRNQYAQAGTNQPRHQASQTNLVRDIEMALRFVHEQQLPLHGGVLEEEVEVRQPARRTRREVQRDVEAPLPARLRTQPDRPPVVHPVVGPDEIADLVVRPLRPENRPLRAQVGQTPGEGDVVLDGHRVAARALFEHEERGDFLTRPTVPDLPKDFQQPAPGEVQLPIEQRNPEPLVRERERFEAEFRKQEQEPGVGERRYGNRVRRRPPSEAFEFQPGPVEPEPPRAELRGRKRKTPKPIVR